jgi:hypothetical protein
MTQPTPNASEDPHAGAVAVVKGVAGNAVVGEVRASGTESTPSQVPDASTPRCTEENNND